MKLLCFSLDGEYIVDDTKFKSIDSAFEYSSSINFMCSFYPIHLITNDLTECVVAAKEPWNSKLKNKKIGCLSKALKKQFELYKEKTYSKDLFSDYMKSLQI